MITKDEAQTAWSKEDAEAYAQAERRIDAAALRGGRIIVDLGSISGLNQRVKNRISDEYGSVKAGWKVAWTAGDQRDPGPFVELT
jgi:hypothetical protein